MNENLRLKRSYGLYLTLMGKTIYFCSPCFLFQDIFPSSHLDFIPFVARTMNDSAHLLKN